MSKIILHIDLNAFFVRCEELLDPSLEGKAVIIGHEGRGGIVSTCSYAARKYGVSSGMPTYKAKILCPNAIIIGGNYSFYSKKSHEFINYVKKYTPLVEQASIDECFADFTNVLKNTVNPIGFIKEFQLALLKETGLKCSIGVAPTKFLAKMGSDIKKPMGITVIRRKEVRKILDPLPIESFFGIGKKTTPRLRAIGIDTIGELAKRINSDDPETKNQFGKFYNVIKDWINGYGNDNVDVESFDPKSLGHSTTFPRDLNTYDEIKEYVIKISKDISNECERRNKIGKKVQLVLKDNEFKTLTRSKLLVKATNDFVSIKNCALRLLEKNIAEDKMYRLVGVTLQELIDKNDYVEQLSIFDNYDEISDKYSTKLLIAELNRKMNGSIFKTASELLKERDDKHGVR